MQGGIALGLNAKRPEPIKAEAQFYILRVAYHKGDTMSKVFFHCHDVSDKTHDNVRLSFARPSSITKA